MIARRRVHRFVDRLGMTGVVGVGLLMFAAVHFLSAALPERERVAELKQTAARASRTTAPEAGRDSDIAEDLSTFYSFFAESRSLPGALAIMNAAVDSSGMAFEAGEYRLSRDGALKLARYEVMVPLHGSYAQVRNFVAALLQDMPHVAIDDVVIKRDSVDATTIEARLRLSIYLALK